MELAVPFRLPCTEIIVVAVDRQYEADVNPARRINDLGYHGCRVSRVRAMRFACGDRASAPEILWPGAQRDEAP